MDPYIGEIRLLPYGFIPVGWHDCDGSLLSISENDVLFNLLGTTYGGDGQSTFSIPDLRGRVPVHQGQAPGLSNYLMGQKAGTESVTLTAAQMPGHTHTMAVTSGQATLAVPNSTVELGAISGDALYTGDIGGVSSVAMATAMIGPAGGSQPHDNTMPTLAMRFCIALNGIYPVRS